MGLYPLLSCSDSVSTESNHDAVENWYATLIIIIIIIMILMILIINMILIIIPY